MQSQKIKKILYSYVLQRNEVCSLSYRFYGTINFKNFGIVRTLFMY